MKHEENIHGEELATRKQTEGIKDNCFLCNGEKLPFGVNLSHVTIEMLQHISEDHLPLKCGVCSKVYENLDDLKNIEKCCPSSVSIKESPSTEVNLPKNLPEQTLTPLSKINMLWRRKSKEFKEYGTINTKDDKLQRTTSTPMHNNNLMTKTFTDSSSNSTSSIHISRINCINSSSDSDGYSPPVPPPVKVIPPTVSPSAPKFQRMNRSRAKFPVQATPLRQVMTKSIQRAMQQHGNYRQSAFGLQQRKMSFDSTSSSSEMTSTSLMKFPGEGSSPLDLRLSPAIRRFRNVITETVQVDVQCENSVFQETNHEASLGSHIEFEQIEVVIRRSEIKSDSSAMTSYKSCFTESGRSGSLPDIHFTPKLSGNNLLKKTISFEAPGTIDKTPAFLMQADIEQDDDNDDVFFTPRSSPLKTFRRTTVENIIEPEFNIEKETLGDELPRKRIWDFMKNVVSKARRTSEDISETLSNSDKLWKFNFKKPDFVTRAAGLFTSKAKCCYEVQQSAKRRRISSDSSRSSSQTSPAVKRPKIQARRPIGRMRQLS